MSKFSFIVPVYNAEKKIKRCIKSIQNQTYKDIEIVCVNDGSKDNSLRVLQELQEKDNRIKIINQENQGAFQARKTGILSSIGDYIMFVDSDDDLCCATACEKLLEILNNNSVQMVQFASKHYRGMIFKNSLLGLEGIISKEDIRNKYYKDYLSAESERVIGVTLWNKVFSGDILRETINSLDTTLKLGEDLLLVLNYMDSPKFQALYNSNILLYRYNVGVGYSGKLDGSILEEYGELKKYQMYICNKWDLSDDAKYYCNLESVYFLFSAVKTMIQERQDENDIKSLISKSMNYQCILIAKDYFNNLENTNVLFDELKFLASNYTTDEYYEYAKKTVPKMGFKSKVKQLIKRFM